MSAIAKSDTVKHMRGEKFRVSNSRDFVKNERYDYEGLPLDRSIARALICKLYSGVDYRQTPEIRDEVIRYHLKHGGKSPKTQDMRRAVYKILRRFEEEGKALRIKYHGEHQWRILSSNEVRVGNHSCLVFSDNLNKDFGVPALENESVALTFTSPPYWNFVDYAGKEGVGYESSYKEYLNSLLKLFRIIAKKTMPGGRMIVNASNMKSRRSVEGESFVYPIVPDIIERARRAGFTFFDEIIWVKGGANAGALNGRVLFGSYPYPPTPKILDSTFENIVVFTKPGKREKVCKEVKDRSQLTKDEWRRFTKGVWEIPPDRNPDHPATFPMEVAERVVRMYSFADDVVLDPFAGSGTTLIAAEKYDRRGIGFEIARDYEQAMRNKEAEYLKQLTLF